MNRIKNVSAYVLAYSLWVVSMVLSYFVVSRGRDALMSLLVAATYDRYASDPREAFYTAIQVKAAEVWSYLLLGFVMIILIVVLEHVFRTAAQAGQVWPRFSLVILVGFAVLCIFELIVVISSSVVQALSVIDFLVPVIYLVAAVLFWWLWRTIRAPGTAV